MAVLELDRRNWIGVGELFGIRGLAGLGWFGGWVGREGEGRSGVTVAGTELPAAGTSERVARPCISASLH